MSFLLFSGYCILSYLFHCHLSHLFHLAHHAAHVSLHIFRNGYSDTLFRSFTLAALVRAQPDMLMLPLLRRPLVPLLILTRRVLIFYCSSRRPTQQFLVTAHTVSSSPLYITWPAVQVSFGLQYFTVVRQ